MKRISVLYLTRDLSKSKEVTTTGKNVGEGCRTVGDLYLSSAAWVDAHPARDTQIESSTRSRQCVGRDSESSRPCRFIDGNGCD